MKSNITYCHFVDMYHTNSLVLLCRTRSIVLLNKGKCTWLEYTLIAVVDVSYIILVSYARKLHPARKHQSDYDISINHHPCCWQVIQAFPDKSPISQSRFEWCIVGCGTGTWYDLLSSVITRKQEAPFCWLHIQIDFIQCKMLNFD